MKRVLLVLALFVMSCNSGGGSSNNNTPAGDNCTASGTCGGGGGGGGGDETDLLAESFTPPGTTGWTKQKDLGDTENAGQYGAGCEADAQGNAVSKLQVHPNLQVGKIYNVIDKGIMDGHPFQGRVDSDEITSVNGIALEIGHRLHEVQVKGMDSQAGDVDILCKVTNGAESCAQARFQTLMKPSQKYSLNMNRFKNFKFKNSATRVDSCSLALSGAQQPVTRQIGTLTLRGGKNVTAYRMELIQPVTITCDGQNMGVGNIQLIRFVTNDLASPVFDYCGGLPAFDYGKLHIGDKVLQHYLTEFYPAN